MNEPNHSRILYHADVTLERSRETIRRSLEMLSRSRFSITQCDARGKRLGGLAGKSIYQPFAWYSRLIANEEPLCPECRRLRKLYDTAVAEYEHALVRLRTEDARAELNEQDIEDDADLLGHKYRRLKDEFLNHAYVHKLNRPPLET